MLSPSYLFIKVPRDCVAQNKYIPTFLPDISLHLYLYALMDKNRSAILLMTSVAQPGSRRRVFVKPWEAGRQRESWLGWMKERRESVPGRPLGKVSLE